jgi:hypothetical protein
VLLPSCVLPDLDVVKQLVSKHMLELPAPSSGHGEGSADVAMSESFGEDEPYKSPSNRKALATLSEGDDEDSDEMGFRSLGLTRGEGSDDDPAFKVDQPITNSARVNTVSKGTVEEELAFDAAQFFFVSRRIAATFPMLREVIISI